MDPGSSWIKICFIVVPHLANACYLILRVEHYFVFIVLLHEIELIVLVITPVYLKELVAHTHRYVLILLYCHWRLLLHAIVALSILIEVSSQNAVVFLFLLLGSRLHGL